MHIVLKVLLKVLLMMLQSALQNFRRRCCKSTSIEIAKSEWVLSSPPIVQGVSFRTDKWLVDGDYYVMIKVTTLF